LEVAIVTLDSTQTYRRRDELPSSKLEVGTVVVNPHTREVHLLNGMGSRVWELLAASCTVGDLVRALESEGPFDVDESVMAQDLAAYLAALAEKALVSARPTAKR
jgi:Coenzyme PQQ synthesis protein D (PqqD)